jgi:RecB family exonuclease
VLEVESTLGEEGLRRIRRPKTILSPVPQEIQPSSVADWRLQAVDRALAGECNLLAGIFADLNSLVAAGDSPWRDERGPGRVINPPTCAAALEAGIRIVHARARGQSFGPAEGMLASPVAAKRLAARFGAQHLWSPSQWETYASCPYKFFLHDVLGLEPLGDLVLETDFTRRGSRVHDVLAAFHQQWPEVRGNRSLSADEEAREFLDHLHRVIEERIAIAPRVGIEAALLELDRRQIRNWAASHFDHHLKYGSACAKLGGELAPRHLEFRFGPARSGDAASDPNSTSEAFILEVDGEKIRITGQIDRVDVGAIDGQTVFNVIDYKSGKKTNLTRAHIESGERLQLPIYVEAAQMLLFQGKATPLAAGYWSLASGFDSKGALSAAQEQPADDGCRWEETRATVRRLVGQFVAAIRHGDFPVASRDDKCTSYCEFHTVCRVGQVRSLKKTPSGDAAGGLAPSGARATGDP